MRLVLTLGLLVLTLGAAACGNSTTNGKSAASGNGSTNAETTPGAKNTKTTTPRVKKDGLTGFGATVGAWNDHHDEDTRFSPGSAYDPDPSLGDGERFDDRYYGVMPEDGRITSYSMRFPAQTGIAEAKAFILSADFPRDAKIVWFKRKDTCAQMLVRSSKLARITHDSALIEFSSGEAADHYNPRAVSDAILLPVIGSGKGIDC